ncbi:SIMPL domain-containing protein [Streptomyces sp. NPDC029004]|uniref:SIMPL domain-containing protein n=1 Tax=Streptomyces sp. NPDC029004 TaxID=3154490 RepID=UPI0033C67F4E
MGHIRVRRGDRLLDRHAKSGYIRRGIHVLLGHRVPDTAVSTSRLNLESTWSYGNERKFLGYECTAAFVIELRELDILEAVLIDVVEAGANEVRPGHSLEPLSGFEPATNAL